MNESGKNNDTILREAPLHYTEEYGNSSVYLQRMERLRKLGYKNCVDVSTEVISEYQSLIDDMSQSLTENKHDLVQISCTQRVSLLSRSPESPLPTAQEDFDQLADADTITVIAITEVANTHRKRTHDQILAETDEVY